MRFLCKKCGAQSPGDLSGIEVRDGALVFTCTSCGTSATLVAGKAGAGAGSAEGGSAPVEKGVVEPDEDELVDLGEATLSRMLGRKVRIVAEPGEPEEAPVAATPAEAPVSADAATAAGPEPQAAAAAEEPSFSVAPDVPEPVVAAVGSASSRRRLAGLLAAGVVLGAVVGFALLEARQPSSKEAGRVAASGSRNEAAPAQEAAALDCSATPANGSEPSPETSAPSLAASEAPRKPVPAAAPDDETVIEVKELARSKTEAAPVASSPAAAAAGGSIPPEVLEGAFWRVRPGVRMCATQEQRRDPDAALGEEAVSVTFGPSGEVTGVAFQRKQLESEPLGACLANEMRKVRLEPAPGRPVTVRRVLSLSRSSSG